MFIEVALRTFHALSDKQMILSKLEEVANELAGDMTSGGWTGKTVTLKYKLDTYQGTSFQEFECSWWLTLPVTVFTKAKSFDRWVSQKKEELFAVRLIDLRIAAACFSFLMGRLPLRLARSCCLRSCL
jgi:DNA polymerase kappa